jgi:hypothetical protein
MSSLVIAGNTSGSVTLSAPTVAGSQTFTLPYGGATTTSSAVDITLTNTSNRVQNIAMTAIAKSVILPDATTMATGGQVFIINNTGNYAINIQLNSGYGIYRLPPQASLQLSLIDNSTAQGKWSTQIGPKLLGQTLPVNIDGTNLSSAYQFADMVGYVQALPLTSTTMLLIWGRGDGSMYAVVATNSSGTLSFGTVTQIYSGTGATSANCFIARMLSSTAGILTVDRNSNSVAVGITISGTSISASPASATFGTITNNVYAQSWAVFSMCAMSSTQALITYYNGSGLLVNTVTHNGASAPTIGTASSAITIAATAILTPNFAAINLTATTAQIFYCTTINSVQSTRIVTISGTSAPTLGTAVTFTTRQTGYSAVGSYSATETWFSNCGNSNISSTAYPTTASFTISGTTITVQRVIYLGVSTGLQAVGTLPTKVDSTTWLAVDWNQLFVQKYVYVSGENIYSSGSNEQAYLAVSYGTGITQYSMNNNAFNLGNLSSSIWNGYNFTSAYPGNGAGQIQMFSGSSTTGIITGTATIASSATSASTSGLPQVNLFTIL